VSAPSFLLSEEHEEFRGALRRFAEKEIAPHAADADEREAYPQASMDALRDSGFVRALYPLEHGGDVTCEPSPTGGARFVMDLPLK